MNVLLLGGSGQLGTEIQRCWSDANITAPAHADLDIADSDAIVKEIERGYDLVVNCAAFHNVDACEANPVDAFRYNAIAVDSLAATCAERNVEFLTISTDYVFDGEANRPYTENERAEPIQTYGISKLAGELLVRRRNMKAYVVRTCGIYGVRTSSTKGYTFIDRVLSQLRAGEPVRVVSDVIASPTYARDLAIALRQLVATKAYGLYHAVNGGPVSWYDFAVEAARQEGIEQQIEAISAGAWKAAAHRPQFSALDNARLGELGIVLPDWRSGVQAYLHDRGRAQRVSEKSN